MAGTNVLSRIDSLRELAQDIEQRETELADKRTQFRQLSQEIGEAADSGGFASTPGTNGQHTAARTGDRTNPNTNQNRTNPNRTTATANASRSAALKGNKNAAGNRGGANRAKAKNKNRQAGHKVAPSERNYSNEMSLREAVWDVMSRRPAEWRKLITDLPANVKGLKISEIKTIIEAEGKWVSSSENISPQVQQQVYKFRDEGKVERDDRRYFILPGAKLDK